MCTLMGMHQQCVWVEVVWSELTVRVHVGGQGDTRDEELDERRRQTCNDMLRVLITGI